MPKAHELLDYFAKKAAHFSNNRAILTRQKKKNTYANLGASKVRRHAMNSILN